MRAGKELLSPSGRQGGLLLPMPWKFLPEKPACDFVFPSLSNSSAAQYSLCFCLQPGFNPADLLLLLCHCWHGVLCWRGLPELLQVSTANLFPLCSGFSAKPGAGRLLQLCLHAEKGPEDGSERGFVAEATYLENLGATLHFSRSDWMKRLLCCIRKGREILWWGCLVLMSSETRLRYLHWEDLFTAHYFLADFYCGWKLL